MTSSFFFFFRLVAIKHGYWYLTHMRLDTDIPYVYGRAQRHTPKTTHIWISWVSTGQLSATLSNEPHRSPTQINHTPIAFQFKFYQIFSVTICITSGWWATHFGRFHGLTKYVWKLANQSKWIHFCNTEIKIFFFAENYIWSNLRLLIGHDLLVKLNFLTKIETI